VSLRSSQMGSLLGTGMRGLRSRLLLTLGSILLAAISVGAAVVGPMYQAGAASSYLVAKLRAEPNLLTGLVFDYQPSGVSADGVAAALSAARRAAQVALNDEFGPPTLALRSQRLTGFPGYKSESNLLSAPGACDHVVLAGRCPTKPGEALILKQDSAFASVKIGQTVRLHGLRTPITVVGTYTPRASDEAYWFNLRDLESVPPQPTASGGLTPYRPAPFLVTQQTFSQLPQSAWFVRATRRLTISPRTTLNDLRRATQAVAAVKAAQLAHPGAPAPGALTPEIGNELVAVSQEVQERRSTATSTLAPAVVSVVLVALVLLMRLLSAAMELRRSELALASLRGFSRRQMWVLGLLEPALMMVIATPIGIVGGYLSARALAGAWLLPGLPTPLRTASVLAALGVVVATLVVAAMVVRDSLSEPLSAQIAGVRRPGRSGRWSRLLQLVLVAAAVSVLVATLASGRKSTPDATDLALPILLAVAAGVVSTLGAQSLARTWAQWTAGRRGVFSYLASRTIARRREGTLVILPLTAALAIAVFAAGVFTAAADWRASDAATEVGADVSYATQLTMDQAVALTHEIDPGGRWLMAIGAEYDGASQTLVMDTPRLPRVGLWPDSWTPGASAAEIARELSVQRQGVKLVGSRVSLTIDNSVTGTFRSLTVSLELTTPNGSRASVLVGPFPPGRSTRSAKLPGCERGCLVQQMSFGGPAGLTGVMKGEATVSAVQVDGADVAAALDLSWRVPPPLFGSPAGVDGTPRVGGGALVVRFDAKNSSYFAAITPGDVPAVRPVVLGRSAHPPVASRAGDTLRLRSAVMTLDVHPVATAESMPVLGPAGMLIDYTMLTRDQGITDAFTFVTILARSDTPASVTAALADHGISEPQTLSTTRHLLDQDAFALALNLYLVVTAIVILLALAGLGANLAVQMPARRRDAASLRVVGLRRRSIIASVVAEFVVVLGAAALAGILAGSLAQYVVVRTVTLGYADTEHTPRLLPSFNLGSVGDLLLLVTAILLVVAVTVAGLTVRGARTASLRENAR
jgi:putative ABC transport system permease protein